MFSDVCRGAMVGRIVSRYLKVRSAKYFYLKVLTANFRHGQSIDQDINFVWPKHPTLPDILCSKLLNADALECRNGELMEQDEL